MRSMSPSVLYGPWGACSIVRWEAIASMEAGWCTCLPAVEFRSLQCMAGHHREKQSGDLGLVGPVESGMLPGLSGLVCKKVRSKSN